MKSARKTKRRPSVYATVVAPFGLISAPSVRLVSAPLDLIRPRPHPNQIVLQSDVKVIPPFPLQLPIPTGILWEYRVISIFLEGCSRQTAAFYSAKVTLCQSGRTLYSPNFVIGGKKIPSLPNRRGIKSLSRRLDRPRLGLKEKSCTDLSFCQGIFVLEFAAVAASLPVGPPARRGD